MSEELPRAGNVIVTYRVAPARHAPGLTSTRLGLKHIVKCQALSQDSSPVTARRALCGAHAGLTSGPSDDQQLANATCRTCKAEWRRETAPERSST